MNSLRLRQRSQRYHKHTGEYEACGKLHGSDRSVKYELRTI